MNEPSPSSAEPTALRKIGAAAHTDPPPFEGPQGYERFRDEGVIPRFFEVSTDPAAFYGRLKPLALGAATLIGFDMAACGYERSATRVRRDGVDHVWVQLINTGGLSACSPGRSVDLGPGSAALCDFSVETEQVSLASTGLVLMMPRDLFGRVDVGAMHGGAILGARFDLLHDHLMWLRETAPLATPVARERASRSLSEVVAACLTPSTRPAEAAVGDLGAAALRRARAYMIANLHRTELHGSEIAKAVGVSRSTLYRLCAPEGGVAETLWAIRLEAARRALSDPATPGRIGDIAGACGFKSLPHFSRRFRDHYGFAAINLRPF